MISSCQKEHLLSLYKNMSVFHGELHDHSASGGTSDGKCDLAHWNEEMPRLKMDFAAILDHRQVRHMYLPEWEQGSFIPGTEPGTCISDAEARNGHMHYNILMPERGELKKILSEFPEYEFTGSTEGHFIYPSFTRARFTELINAVLAHGGFFVHPHPKQVMDADDPNQYWFRDETGIEVFYMGYDSEYTKKNYALWLDLLKAGKRLFACAGGDWHSEPGNTSLTTLYAEEKTPKAFLKQLRKGNFTCGQVSLRMAIGDTVMGGVCDFTNQTLLICVSDFHESVKKDGHKYRLDILNDKGVVKFIPVSMDECAFASIETENCAFYRAELFDETENIRIAIGNPIWNILK